MPTLEEAIGIFEQLSKLCETNGIYDSQELYKQYAAWLRILKKAKFEYDEAWRTLTHPTPDVRYPDINRAKIILDVFENSLGLLDAERRTDD